MLRRTMPSILASGPGSAPSTMPTTMVVTHRVLFLNSAKTSRPCVDFRQSVRFRRFPSSRRRSAPPSPLFACRSTTRCRTFHVGPGAHGQQPAHVAFDVVVVFREFDFKAAETGAEGQALFERQTDPLAVLGCQRLSRFGGGRGGREDGDDRPCPEARHHAAKISNHGPNGRRKARATQAGHEPGAGQAG